MWWVPAVAALVLVDHVTGPDVPVPAIYSVPVALAAWYSGRTAYFESRSGAEFSHGICPACARDKYGGAG